MYCFRCSLSSILLTMFSITAFGRSPFSISTITFSTFAIVFSPKIPCSFEINVMLLCSFTQALLDILQYHAGQETCLEAVLLCHVSNNDGDPSVDSSTPMLMNGLHCMSADAARTVDMLASISLNIWGESYLAFHPCNRCTASDT